MKFEYYCVLLDEKSHNILLEKTAHLRPEGSKVFAHHMTITHAADKDLPMQEWAESHLGGSATLKVVRVGISDKALAVEVTSEVPSSKKLKHVTVATMNNGKPFESNNIKNWHSIDPFELTGKITRIG